MRRALLVILLAAGCGDSTTPSSIDAAVPDAGVPDAIGLDAAALGVPCGDSMFCEPSTSQGCCEDPPAEPACEPIGGLCLGDLTSCDGPEDCAGDICCDYGQGPGCGDAASCTPENGGTPVCHGPC